MDSYRAETLHLPLLDLVPRFSGAYRTVIAARQRSTLYLIAAFWLFTFAVLSIHSAVSEALPFQILGPRRLLTAAFGTLLCLAMVRLHARLRSRSFPRWILWGTIGALVMAIAVTGFSMVMNRIVAPLPGMPAINTAEMIQRILLWFGYCLAWTGTHLAMTYHWEVEDEQQRAAALVELAQQAQIAALRYQINPHFLFNTLNSISALVMERRNDDAESMLLNLSAFVRTTFATDPSALIPLSEEVGLQRLYLEIEEARFSERMRVIFEIPESLEGALVPALILQPLVENALRHGVGESEAMTVVRICAARRSHRLQLLVDDDGAGWRRSGGTGLGLNNVRDRLQAHFGDQASFTAGARATGGFRVELELPLELAA
ncbi:hypothetical protein GCM10009087_02080 [Sphingomonas oligophenolica]